MIHICIKKFYSGEDSFSILGTFDIKGNPYHVFAKMRDLTKHTNESWDKPIGLFGRASNGFYVYIPLHHVSWLNKKLSDDERALFYDIQLIADTWDPLDLLSTGCPIDEYTGETWKLFEILRSDGITKFEKQINELFEGSLNCNRKAFLLKSKLVTKHLLRCAEANAFTFEDIIYLNKKDVQRLIYYSPEINNIHLVTALKGSTKDIQNHIFSSLSKVTEKMRREDMDFINPSLAEINEAKQKITNVARKLINSGEITLEVLYGV